MNSCFALIVICSAVVVVGLWSGNTADANAVALLQACSRAAASDQARTLAAAAVLLSGGANASAAAYWFGAYATQRQLLSSALAQANALSRNGALTAVAVNAGIPARV